MFESDLASVVGRPQIVPWEGVTKIPWDDPDFSRRMLEQHLDQGHPGASRTFETIDRHVAWIETSLLRGRANARILDLGCGPGLYCVRLAARGHRCHGIDFSPASIAHATALAAERRLEERCTFELGDVLRTPFGQGYDLVMMTYGELNTFRLDDARTISRGVAGALRTGGTFAVEINTPEDVRRVGETAPSWHSAERGLFSDDPYICLRENQWFEDVAVTVSRYLVIDVGAGRTTVYQSTMQAYSDEACEELMNEAGVGAICSAESLSGDRQDSRGLRVLWGTRS